MEKIFHKIEKDEPIQVKVVEFNGEKYLDIRKWYYGKNNELQPLKKGITLDYEDAEEILDILSEKKWEILETMCK